MVLEECFGDLNGDRSSRWVWLCVEKWDEVWEGEGCEDGEVALDGCEEKLEDGGLCLLRVEVGAVDVLADLFSRKGED